MLRLVFWRPLLASLFLFGAALSPNAWAQEGIVGSWAGTLEVGGTQLRIVFHIRKDESGLAATMDSPGQGATGIPVTNVTVSGDSVTLTVGGIGGEYAGVLDSDKTKIEGTWSQGGQSIPLTLTPAGEEDKAPPPRPQHPEPPYPYDREDVTFRNDEPGITLAGTLTRPQGEGPHPGVVLVSGSGPQDRNSEIVNHKIFLVLADHLTRQGIAVLRYDERGVGESEGSFSGATSEDFAGDVAAGVRFLKERPDLEPTEVGLIGLSEGGIVAPMVHTNFEPVSFLVLMAGPSVAGGDIIVEQSAKIAAAGGAAPSALDSLRQVQGRLMDAVRAGSDSASVASRLRPILDREGMSEEQMEAQLGQMTSPWFRYFVGSDPVPALRKIDVPVLALYGSKDLQVPPEQNASPMRAALRDAPTSDATVRVLDGLNHIFQPAETGSPSRYGKIETTMAPEALEKISTWIRERTSAGE